MPVETIDHLSRYLYAFLLLMAVLAALGWIRTEARFRQKRLRMIPSAGTIGELMVIQGSRDLPPQTWFPVTHEGVLGSVRSCDLVIPCPGVKAHHLDFSWQEGLGLIVRPRSGCKVIVDGVQMDCRSNHVSCPLVQGSCLQVGQAVLRLHVLKAFDHTCSEQITLPPRESVPPQPESAAEWSSSCPPPAVSDPGYMPDFSSAVPAHLHPDQTNPVCYPVQPVPCPSFPPSGIPAPEKSASLSGTPEPEQTASPSAAPDPASPRRPRASKQWEEDWGE